MESQGQHFVITLVHGTWARGAAWTKPGSTIRQELCQYLQSLGATRIEFRRLNWSGSNRYEDRRYASAKLRCRLLRQHFATPQAAQFVVAHSHGGNIALRAVLRSRRLRKEIGGIIAIATPFLKFERQNLALLLSPAVLLDAAGSLTSGFRGIMIQIMSLILYFPLSRLFLDRWEIKKYDWVHHACVRLFNENICNSAFQMLLAVYCLAASASWVAMALSEGRERTLKRSGNLLATQRRRILARFGYFQPQQLQGGIPLLSLSSPIDEALVALTGSWWVHRASAWFGRTVAMLAIASAALIFGTVLYWGLSLIYKHWRDAGSLHLLFSKISYACSLIAAPIILFCLVAPIIFLIASIVARSSPGLGLSNPRNNLLWCVRAYRELDGSPYHTVRRYTLPELIRGSRALLFHSRIYSFGPAIQDMAQWIDGVQRN